MDLQITVEERKAKQFVAFLKELDFVEVKKTLKTPAENKKSNPTFSYFGACPDWDIEASELRAMGNRKKALAHPCL